MNLYDVILVQTYTSSQGLEDTKTTDQFLLKVDPDCTRERLRLDV